MSENVNQENKQEQENTDTPETQPQQEPSPETAEETFTVTRDQMEKMEQLAKMVSDASDKYRKAEGGGGGFQAQVVFRHGGIRQLPQTHRQGKGEPVRRRQGRHREALPGGAG